MLTDFDNAVTVAFLVPVTGFIVLDPANHALTIMGKGRINCLRYKQVGNVIEAGHLTHGPIDIGAELHAVANRKKNPLVLKLEVCPQTLIHLPPESPALGIVVNSLRMKEATHPL